MADGIDWPTEDEVRQLAYSAWEQRGGLHGYDQTFWHFAEEFLFLTKNYNSLCGFELKLVGDKKTFFGSKGNRVCRYCGRSKPEVNFKKEAHSVPELLGNKNLISYDECDPCNTQFGETIENDLAAMLNLPLIFSNEPGKKTSKKQKFKAGDDKVTEILTKQNEVMVTDHHVTSAVKLDLEAGRYELDGSMKSGSLIPINVFKSIVKAGFALMPEDELRHFPDIGGWLLSSDPTFRPFGFVVPETTLIHIPGRIQHDGHVALYERKSDEANLPCWLFSVLTKGIFILVYLPFCRRDDHITSPATLPTIPVLSPQMVNHGCPTRTHYNLSGTEKTAIYHELGGAVPSFTQTIAKRT